MPILKASMETWVQERTRKLLWRFEKAPKTRSLEFCMMIFSPKKIKKKKISTGIIRFSQQIYIAFRLCENQVANKSTSPLESRYYSPLKLSEVQEMQIF